MYTARWTVPAREQYDQYRTQADATEAAVQADKNAVETATRSLRDLRIAEVQKLDVKIDNGKIVAYRARVQVSFKYES